MDRMGKMQDSEVVDIADTNTKLYNVYINCC